MAMTPDIDPENMEKKRERVAKAEQLWDLLLDNLVQLFEGNTIKAKRTYTDKESGEIVEEEIYAEVTAQDRANVIRMMTNAGVSLDPALLPKSLRDAMRRQLNDPGEDIQEQDVA